MRRSRRVLSLLARRMLYEAQLIFDSCGAQVPDTDAPVWLLGCRYCTQTSRDQLLADFRSRLWLTYRRGFEPVGGSGGPTSDRGWGCMLRCVQMMLAEALSRTTLGREWRWSTSCLPHSLYLQLRSAFYDCWSAPFSIHRLAQLGARCLNVPVGTWYGPNTAAHAMRLLLKQLSTESTHLQLQLPAVHVAMDSLLVKQAAINCARTQLTSPLTGGGSGELNGEMPWRPLLLLIPLRLGLHELNQVYADSISCCFTIPHTLGIIGGTPNHALYFVGSFSERVIYLDPHTTQNAVSSNAPMSGQDGIGLDDSYHCDVIKHMSIGNMESSLAVAFLCSSEDDFQSLCEHIQRLLINGRKYPMFEMCDSAPSWTSGMTSACCDDVTVCSNDVIAVSDEEEFEIL